MITEEEVKTLTSIGNNVDVRKFCNWIEYAQDVQIKPIIGETCYDELLDQVAASSIESKWATVLDGDDRNLPGLKRALAWWVLYYSYPDLFSHISATGVQVKTGEKFGNVSDKHLEMRRNQARGRAEYYTEQLICYLCENENSFDCLNGTDCCVERNVEGYGSSGIILDDGEGKLSEFDRINGRKTL